MRVIFSRKGFDSASGGFPSPIINGRPISLAIPTTRRSETTYEQLGVGDLVERASRGKIGRSHLCHEDPMFAKGRCIFGQTGAAQSHLANNSVGTGDIFLFFGLFSDEGTAELHHRIFGFLRIETVVTLGPTPDQAKLPCRGPRRHPHTIGEWNDNNTVYVGVGGVCRFASDALRLTRPGGPVSLWQTPGWLQDAGLTYHQRADRWLSDGLLRVVARGQEFVTHVDGNSAARAWVDGIVTEIRR